MDRIDLIKARSAMKPHGTRARYVAGRCCCVLCRAANSRYQCEREAAKSRGDFRGLVSTAEVRMHLESLSKLGVGYKAVADAASVARSIVAGVRSGKRARIRASAARRILAVGTDCIADGALVPAAVTWRRVKELLRGGYSKKWIAQQLGHQAPALQIGSDRVRAITASRIERLYVRVMAGRVARV